MIEVTAEELLRMIGVKEVVIARLEAQLMALQQQIAQLTEKKETPHG